MRPRSPRRLTGKRRASKGRRAAGGLTPSPCASSPARSKDLSQNSPWRARPRVSGFGLVRVRQSARLSEQSRGARGALTGVGRLYHDPRRLQELAPALRVRLALSAGPRHLDVGAHEVEPQLRPRPRRHPHGIGVIGRLEPQSALEVHDRAHLAVGVEQSVVREVAADIIEPTKRLREQRHGHAVGRRQLAVRIAAGRSVGRQPRRGVGPDSGRAGVPDACPGRREATDRARWAGSTGCDGPANLPTPRPSTGNAPDAPGSPGTSTRTKRGCRSGDVGCTPDRTNVVPRI
jgi:hypothetical protein